MNSASMKIIALYMSSNCITSNNTIEEENLSFSTGFYFSISTQEPS